MPAPKNTTKAKKTVPAKKQPAPIKKQAAPPKPPARAKPAAPPRTSPAEALRKSIVYYYLLSFAPPVRIGEFKTATGEVRKQIAASAGMPETDFFTAAVPEVCRRIVAFHQDTREPDKAAVAALAKSAQGAEKDAAGLAAFQNQMERIASLPGRAKKENRLHRDKGCDLCAAPCRYGYFSLVSEPQMKRLQEMMAAESAKPASEQSPLGMMYRFTLSHILSTPSPEEAFMDIGHLANLSYCLLILGMAKSRLAMPEEQLTLFQRANQELIRRSRENNLGPAA